jgi:hypothetical protein
VLLNGRDFAAHEGSFECENRGESLEIAFSV